MKKNNSFLAYKELPACIKGQLISFIMLGAGLIIFGLSLTIGMQSLNIALFTLIILIAYAAYCISWSYPFFANKVLIIEGKVKDIENNDKTEKGLSGTFARELVRYTFTLDVNGNDVSVIKTGNKIRKKDANVILYVPEDAVNLRSDGTTLISRILYAEIVK
ncbi:MAG: hypothetical protein J6I68_14695 [Butyrivibrio sp.]|uniref:hypothetical protein n=1 Tax=Butyrivibrio sp. TaxID=28121 RepID=UPI001B4CEEA0|nr:hypothetical protein [Butyrivibrio sp.]MBP3784491.1 hypothetical protein [Butyrivibrio sp.]